MANVKVAIRVRPLNARENKDGGRVAVQVEDKVVRIRNRKLEGRLDSPGDSRERWMEFGFDYCYWSVDPEAPHYASQEEVFQDLGVSVLAGASEGYNVCLFAYGQTGSGKTYTMIGTPASIGLTPRICQGLFRTEDQSSEGQSSSRVEISFLEIYNERVRDLLRRSEEKKPSPLRVREHPEKGPYVQGLSQHVVSEYKQAVDLLEEGISKRITAATHIHDTSSRSHAIFSIQYTQAILENNRPSEIVSKINLVDLAGSERADPNYCRDRITEGSNINKSLVTLGIVISALAQNSQMFSSCQSINSEPSEEGGSTAGSQSSSLSGGGRRHCFIPYRDSVLTWLLKDSLGGNSRTIMIATVSPSSSSYNETLSTLRYAAHARNIVNKPRINEDANVRLIRELREEIDRLKSMLLSCEMQQRNPSPSLSEERDGSISELVLQNELKVEQLTKDWSDCWRDQRKVLEQYSVDINRDRAGFLIHSHLPHLIALDRDVLSTGVTFYTLKEGVTMIGPHDQSQIVLQGESSCEIVNQQGTVTLRPIPGSVCLVNEREVTEPCRLAQGAVITLGGVNKFRFNHPAEAAILKERRRESEGTINCYSADLRPMASNTRPEGDGCWEQGVGGGAEAHPPRQQLEEQQRYIATLKEEIRAEQQRAEKDLESEQAHLRLQQREIQQWILLEKERLAATEEQGKQELGVQTDPVSLPYSEETVSANTVVGGAPAAPTLLSVTVGDRKKVVQEELLRHHALRRAENRVRRKRLNYQLAKIAQKRHLLEAKRELQRLENALPPGQDSPTSTELGYLSKTRGPPYDIRRHSFSADILSRLYPQHAPSFCHFLRRNKSSDFSPAFWRSQGPRKWVSEECLPSKKTRSRSNTMPSESSPSTVQQTSFPERLNYSMTHVPVLINRPKRRCPLSIKNHKEDSQADLGSPEQARKSTKKSSSMSITPGCSNVKSPSQSNKSLERIRKAFSHSVGPGIRTALSRVFRKPPSGFKRKNSKSPNKSTKRSQDNSEERETKVTDGQSRKVTLSCEDLGRSTASEVMRQKRWNRTDVLVKVPETPTSRQWKLAGCKENKQEDQGDGSSDCDSSFSVDSLSSAYATALAEQLKQEDSDLSEYDDKSEAGSVDSQMSQDSLVMESSKKNTTVRPLSKSAEVYHHPVMTNHCQSMVFNWQLSGEGIEKCSSLDSCSYDEMPAEAYWKLHGVSQSKVSHKPKVVNEVAQAPKWAVVSGDLQETQPREEPASGPLATDNTVRPFSASSSREPESLLVSTDAWSSTETTDSPRTDRVSTFEIHRVLHNSAECNSSTQGSEILSDSLRSSESQVWSTSDCTEGENTTVELQKHWGSGTSTCSSMLQKTLEEVNVPSSADTIVDPAPEPLFGDVCHSEGCPIILSGKENEGGVNSAMGTSDYPEGYGNSPTESIPSGNHLEKTVPASACKSCPTPTTVLKNLKPDNELETSHCNDKPAFSSIPKELKLGISVADLIMENKTSGNTAEYASKNDRSSSKGSIRGENIPEDLTLAVNLPKFDTDTLSRLDKESKLSYSPLSDPQSNMNEGSVMLSLQVQCCEIVQKSSPEESAVDFTPQNDCPNAKNTSESPAQTEEGNIADVSKPWQHANYQDRNEMQYDIEAEGQNLLNTDSLITSGGVCGTDHFVLENEQNIYACPTTSYSQTDPVEGHQVKAVDPVFSCIPDSELRIGENMLSSGYSRGTDHNANEQNAAITAEEVVEREEKRGTLFLPKPTTGLRPSNDVNEAKMFTISKTEVEVNKKMDIECNDHTSCEMDRDESEGDQGEDEGEWQDYEPGEVRDYLEEIAHKQCKPEKMAVLLKKGVIPRAMAPTYEASKLSCPQKKEKSRMHRGQEILHRIPKKTCMEAEDNLVDSAASNMGKLGSDLQGDFSGEENMSPAWDLSNYSPVHCYKDNSKQIENDFGFATSQNDTLVSEICGETSCFTAKNEGLETHHEHHVRERSPIDQEIFEVVQKLMKTSSKGSQDDSSGGENGESSSFILNVPCKQGPFEESNPCASPSAITPRGEGNPSPPPENGNGSEVKNLRDHLHSAEALSFENSVPPVFLPFTEIKFHQDDYARVNIPRCHPEQCDPNAVALTSRTVAMSSPKTMESGPLEKQRTSSCKGHDFRLKDLNMQSYDRMNYVQIGSTGKICSIACEPATKEQCGAQMKHPMSLEPNDCRQLHLNKSKVTSIDDCASIIDKQNHQKEENVSLAANPIPAEVVAEEKPFENDANKNPMDMNTSGNKTGGSGSVVQSSSFRRDLTDVSGSDRKININRKQAVEQADQESRTRSPYLSDDALYYKSQSNVQFKEIDQAQICVPALHPEGNYLENACASSKVRSVALFREEKRSVIVPPSESFGSNTPPNQSCPKASCGELSLSGNGDYLDVRMSRWTACLHPASRSNMEEVFESHPGPPNLIIKEEHKSSKCSSNSEHEDKRNTVCALNTVELKLDSEHSLQNDSEGYLCSAKDLFPEHKECQQYSGKSEIPESDCNKATKPAGVCANTAGCESVAIACFLDPNYRNGDEEMVKQIVSASNVPSPEAQYDCLPHLRNSETNMIKFASPISSLSNFGAPNLTENHLLSVYDQIETGFNAQYNENCTPICQTEELRDIRHEMQEANRQKDSSGLNSAQIECTEMAKGLLVEGLSKTVVTGTNCHENVQVELKNGCATSSHAPSEMKLVSDFGEGEIFGSVHAGHQQCSNNGNVDHRRGKQKHFRRANRRVPSTSSTESMLDSSPEEKVVCRVYPGRMQNRPEAQARHKHDVPVSSCRTCSGFTKGHPMTTSVTKNVDKFDGKPINGGNRPQREPNSNMNPEKTPTMGQVRKKTNICGDHSACAVISSKVGSHETLKPCLQQHEKSVAKLGNVLSQEENQALPKKDAGMHFASSDINPFLHSWQEPEPSKGTYKNQIFGSATDISCKLPQPHDHSNAVARCHSADNGLNNENSPFCSHLSTYANKRELSSSFEDFKERDSMERRLQTCHYTSNPDCAQDPRTCDSFRNDVSGDLSNSSGQVDEIMLVYSSEQESIACPRKDHIMLTRDQSTQTLILEGRQRKKNRHKRSSTQEPMTRMDTMETGAPTMWASLQNMSLHLSELIHNTSDLLGDIRCVRAKESFPKTDCYGNVMAHLHSFGSGKRDCSTQTAVDIGLQTREFPVLESYKEMNDRQVIEKAKPHEVNVIVKVIGSDVQDISQNLEDITLKVRGRAKDGSAAEKMKSMPDLGHGNSGAAGRAHISTDTAPQKVWVSKPSVVTNLKSYNHCNSDSPLEVFPRHVPERISSNSSNTASLEKQDSLRGGSCCLSGHQKMCPEQVCFIDRACSPILTLEPAIGTQMGRSKSTQCLVDQQKVGMNKSFLEQHNVQSAPWINLNRKAKPGFSSNHAKEQQGMQTSDGSSKLVGLTSNRFISSFSPENIGDVGQCNSDVVEGYLVNLVSYKGSGDPRVSRNVTAGTKQQSTKEVPVYKPSSDQSPKRAILSPYLSNGAPIHSHVSSVNSRKQDESVLLDCRQEFSSEKTSQLLSPPEDQFSYCAATLENRQRIFEDAGESWSGPSEPSNVSEDTIQLQEDDAISLAPSECNTDILININPLLNVNQKEHQRVPEDLPMHNKFTNWSGVSDQPPSIASSSMAQSASKCYGAVKRKSSCVNPSGAESQGSGLGAEVITPRRRRAKEIEMLRKDREQVMAAIRLDMNPHQLTVELTEAKLHYGLGETDAMLKLLKTKSKEEPPEFPTKQQLYNRHRRSIEGLRQEREVRLQNCRRARSLSPGKQPSSPRQGAEPPTRAPELPSRRREYLQHLRQVVVEGTRMQEPPKQAAQCPSEIELMLRDYGRAREEARMEIARARDRLRERTEQEKRRLQQRALSRAMKNDLRVRTRVSSSTLCTGSSLSLSSGPTSGYNSSNTAPLKQGANSAQTLQVPGSPHDGGLKVRGRPPIHASQNVDTQRPWLSVQDLRLEVPVSGSNSQLPSPCGHHRTLSTNLSSSLSTCYQDIAKYTHERAVTEVRSAAAGDLGNLLEGKAYGGWKYQGTERGVQAFYKPSSSPTVHGFLGVMEVERPLPSLWCMIRDHSKAHLYNESVRSALTRPLDDNTQLVYLLTDASACHLIQPRDFCCISTESKQQGEWVLAMRSVFEESLPRPSAEAVRGELLPSAWVLQPTLRHGGEVVRVTYLLQVDLGTPALPRRLLSAVAKKQAAIIAELDSLLSP